MTCCAGKQVLSCQPIQFDTDSFGDYELDLSPLATVVQLIGITGDNQNSYHYANANESVDMFITYNAAKGSAYGHLTDGLKEASYVIEFCGDDIHVLKSLDVQMLKRDSNRDRIDNHRILLLPFFSHQLSNL